MNGISVKYLVVCGILLLSLMQLDGTSDNQPVEAHLDLIQDENQITIVGSVISSKHIVVLGGNEMNNGSGKRRSKRQDHVIGLTVLFKSIPTLKNKNIEPKYLSLYYCIKSISWIMVIE